jgi:hypothetical protein
MKDTATPQGTSESGRSSYRKVWWLRFLLPPVALFAWWYFAGTAVSAYHLAREGEVVSGEVTEAETRGRTHTMTIRFTTSDGRQAETKVAPESCGLKQPGATIKIRYLPSDPDTAQDACDSARHQLSWGAFAVAAMVSALSAQVWRLWLRHRKSGYLPAEYQV